MDETGHDEEGTDAMRFWKDGYDSGYQGAMNKRINDFSKGVMFGLVVGAIASIIWIVALLVL